MIPASGGSRIRRTARIKGDLETVRMWLEEKGAEGGPNLDQLCVIGSGLGGTLAAIWTAADWNWIPNTKGPQGQQVRALILSALSGLVQEFPLWMPSTLKQLLINLK